MPAIFDGETSGSQKWKTKMMMMIATIPFNSSLVLLIEGLCSSNLWEFEFSSSRRNRTDDLEINSPSRDRSDGKNILRSRYLILRAA